jgi:DNA-binding NtrC family response regulator
MSIIKGRAILVIDDDAGMLRALDKVLTSEGAVVAKASWVAEAMERLAEKAGMFDLIITDLRMPVLQGQSILRAVKAAMPEVPVIVITAFASAELRAECVRAGAAAFLEKPLEAPELLAVIEQVFSPHKLHKKPAGEREPAAPRSHSAKGTPQARERAATAAHP